MLPSSQSHNLYAYGGFSSTQDSLSFSPSGGALAGPSSLSADPKAPEMLNHNVKVAIQYVEMISRLSKSTLDGIEHAFHPVAESSPMAVSENLESIRQCIDMFTAHLVSTGIGALPMLPANEDGSMPSVPSEAALLEETEKAVTVMYSRQKQIQENNAVVASLLSAPEGSRR